MPKGLFRIFIAFRAWLNAFIDSEVAKEDEWKQKYDLGSQIETEESYVEKDLQIIKISLGSTLIEVKE